MISAHLRGAARITIAALAILLVISACAPAARQVIPTARPTTTATPTDAPTRTPARDVTPTAPPTAIAAAPTGGPSPTPLFGPTRTAVSLLPTETRVFNPNAPRIEFFTSNVLSVVPGESINLFWSTRGTNSAVIYRLDRTGARSQLWNVAADGSLSVPTRRSERGAVEFVLAVGEGASRAEQTLTVPLACPDVWFFQPPPEACPTGPAQETRLIEEPFERGRMVYIEATNMVYALFNDGFEPNWIAFENRYDPAVHPESEASFQPPPGFHQPLRRLGFVWRGNDVARNRLGLATQPEFTYDGFFQAAISGADETLYATSADGTVIQLLPGGSQWQIITPP